MVVAPAGYEALFRSEFPRLVSLGVTMTGRRDVARELAQETMLRAHRHWDELSTYDVPAAWLRRVMVNLVIDQQRSAKAEHRALQKVGVADATVPAPSVDAWCDLIGGLPARQRAIVTLYYGEDLAVDQIAGLLGVTSGTVKTQLHKARQSIESRMRGEQRG